ncbi:MAG: CoA transferase [Chloroflexi bacterium]|nr:CoA transferase [Chloroflexota bacterium]
MGGALEGIRIVDLSRYLAGPYGSMLLADLGAEVVKIEPPEGDFSRFVHPHFYKGESAYFMSINRNKKSVVLDLKSPSGREVVYDLVKVSDIVFDNYRPGVAERLKVDYDTLAPMNPRIICCSLSGYGRTGPLKERPGFDTIVQARGGGMSLTGEPGKYYRMGIPVGDLAGGMFSAIGMLAALQARQHTGKGQRVDVSLLSGQISLLTYQAAYHLLSGEVPEPVGQGHRTVVPIRAFRAKDGQFVVIECSNQKFWVNLCRALGYPDLATDDRFVDGGARFANQRELFTILEGIFLTRTAPEWLDAFEREEVPSAPINTVDRALTEPQVIHENMVVTVDHVLGGHVRMAGNPVKLSETPGETFVSPPTLGQHTAEITQGLLAYSSERLAELRAGGAFGKSK